MPATSNMPIIARLRKQSVAIHIAAEKECAHDVSEALRKAADLLEEAERLTNAAFGEYACVARKHIPEAEREAWEKNFGAPARTFIQNLHIQET